MAKNNAFRDAATKVGSAVGRVDAKAHKAVKAAHVELVAITKQVDALKKQLAESSRRLKAALK